MSWVRSSRSDFPDIIIWKLFHLSSFSRPNEIRNAFPNWLCRRSISPIFGPETLLEWSQNITARDGAQSGNLLNVLNHQLNVNMLFLTWGLAEWWKKVACSWYSNAATNLNNIQKICNKQYHMVYDSLLANENSPLFCTRWFTITVPDIPMIPLRSWSTEVDWKQTWTFGFSKKKKKKTFHAVHRTWRLGVKHWTIQT